MTWALAKAVDLANTLAPGTDRALRRTMSSKLSREELKAKLNLETSQIAWHDLQTYYARGHVVRVAAKLDLLDVAAELVADNKAQFDEWMSAGQVGDVPPDMAQAWYDQNAELWAVVIAPWVLVQDRDGAPQANA